MTVSKSYLSKAFVPELNMLVYVAETKYLLQEQVKRLALMPPATLSLGQASMAAMLMQALHFKNAEAPRLELQWHVESEIGNIYVESLKAFSFRATLQNPQAYTNELSKKWKNGKFFVRRTYENAAPLQSIVESQGSVVLDVNEYLNVSEQKNCRFNSSVLMTENKNTEDFFKVEQSLAYLIHFLPASTSGLRADEISKKQESWAKNIYVMGSMKEWALDGEGKDLNNCFLNFLCLNHPYHLEYHQEIKFYCPCSQERAERALALLSEREKTYLLKKDQENPELTCEYCGRKYNLSSI